MISPPLLAGLPRGRGVHTMSPIGCWKASRRSWQVARVFVVCLTGISLTTCAWPPVGSKSASLSTFRSAALRFNRKDAIATNRHIALTRTKRVSSLAEKHRGDADVRYGLASFYTEGSQTASGETYDAGELTAAHRTLPFGTRVRVTHVDTGRSVTVRINDRGPFVTGRIVDISHSAAEKLGITREGVAKVKVEVVK